MKENTDGTAIFRDAPVPQAVLKNAVPAMLAMLMVLVYNLADTFFIGQTHDPLQVSAVALATPVFLIFMSVGTVFGIGGTSVISRSLGEGRPEYARRVCAFCMWACVAVGVAMAACLLVFMEPLLGLIGASADTWEMTRSYLTIVSFAGPFVLIANCYNTVIRAEGQSGRAMMGQLLGNALNVVLDPVFILLLHWNVTGAAVATVIGNVVGAGYYILYFLRGRSTLSVNLRDVTLRDRVMSGVLAIGVPAALGSFFMSLSQIAANSKMSAYGDLAVAGYGVAAKVVMITGMVCIGLGQGVQPLLGYCVGAALSGRFRKVMRFSLVLGFGLSAAMAGICYGLTGQIVGAFLRDPDACAFGVRFSRILLTTSFLFGVFYVLLNAIQAAGAGKEALVVNVSRQGVIYIPAMLILEAAVGSTGIVWAQPVADVLSLTLVCVLYRRCVKKIFEMGKAASPS